jgi:hypothetical protein
MMTAPPPSVVPLQLTVRATQYLEAMLANPEGITSIEFPGQRLADGIFKLRRAGVTVETIHEAHDGDAPGHHARYRIVSKIERLSAEPDRLAGIGRPVEEGAHV